MPFGISAGTASLIGAGVSAGAGLIGSAMQSSATSAASDAATQAELQMYNQTREDLSPYREAGTASLTQQQNLLGLNGQNAADTAMSTFQTSPGYQWQLSEGLRGVDAGAAAKGMTRSGATLKGEINYAQGLADQDFTDYYNRLSSMTSTGATAAGQQASANTSTGSQVATNATNAGNTQSSIYGNEASGLSSTINKLFSNTAFQSAISGSGSSGSSGSSGTLTSFSGYAPALTQGNTYTGGFYADVPR